MVGPEKGSRPWDRLRYEFEGFASLGMMESWNVGIMGLLKPLTAES